MPIPFRTFAQQKIAFRKIIRIIIIISAEIGFPSTD